MNPDVMDRCAENEDSEAFLDLYRSHNELEKRKAIKNNTFQHPYNIKECLGEKLGDIVINNLISKEELIEIEKNHRVPLRFELTAKNVLSNNIKLTPTDIDDETMELHLNTIKRIGNRLEKKAELELSDEYDRALQRKVEQLLDEKNKTLNEKIRPAERSIYEQNLSIVVNEFNNCKFAKAKQCIEMKIMNKCKKEIENNSIMIARCLKNILKMSAEKQEREMRNEFYYQMQLARSELYEEYTDEKRECELCWENELKKAREKNDRALKQLKVSLEAEHIQNLTELEHWYEIQKKKKISEQLNTNGMEKSSKKII